MIYVRFGVLRTNNMTQPQWVSLDRSAYVQVPTFLVTLPAALVAILLYYTM
jgi:hypothetical protein